MITHLEPDILECEVKWVLGSITMNKANGGDGIPVELFQILKMMLWKCCTQYASKYGKLSSGHSTGKGQFSFESQRKTMPKNVQTTAELHSSHTASKVMFKILQARLNNTWTVNFQMFKLVLEKAEEPEIKLLDHRKSKRVPEKHQFLLYWLCQRLWLWITINCGEFWKRWEYQTTWPASWEICMQVQRQQLELDMEQQTGSK